jgi:hypothetical protein
VTQEHQAALEKYREQHDALNATILSLTDELRSSRDAHEDIIAREEQQLAIAREMVASPIVTLHPPSDIEAFPYRNAN